MNNNIKKNRKKKAAVQNNDTIKNEITNILSNSNLIQPRKVKIKGKKPFVLKKIQVDTKKYSSLTTNNKTESHSHTKLGKKQRCKKKKKKEKIESATPINQPKSETPTTPTPNRDKKKKPNEGSDSIPRTLQQRKKEKLKQKILQALHTPPPEDPKPRKAKSLSLRERMMQRLQAARFRYINEQIYSTDSKEAQKIFKKDPDAFRAYHEGYRQQVSKWPLNPLDVIINSIQQLPNTFVVADFGCGDAKLAQSVGQKVHSFDLVAANEEVVACDMAHVPLQTGSVDVVVFCLSLMGTNLHEYLLEANRVLKPGGILKIAEVESRFEDVKQFIEAVQRFHFKNTWKDLSHNLFYFLDFKKECNIKNKKKLPSLSLNPCLYKKR